MTRERWMMIGDYCLAWTAALVVYSLVRNVGTIESDGIELGVFNGVMMSPVFGCLFGVVFGIVQINFERLYNQRTPLLKLFFIGTAVSVSVITAIMFVAYFVFIYVLDIGYLSLSDFFFSPSSFIFYGYVILIDILLSLFRQVNLMLGPGVLKKLMKGEFYNPREEERVFMFLDLKSSIEMAERLGHLQYSQMIQDCFNDLAVVSKSRAQIHQYVGDEAVLTWPSSEGIKNQNCIKAFFDFKERINSREAYYLKKYGYKPFFKAGVNMGKVMVAEVGQTKKEIAYHGDTINTAARIQGKCNEYNSELLISKTLSEALSDEGSYKKKLVGDISLRGKENRVALYVVYA